eukprot:350275-Chlamydomonas_euryale.AAC.2
MYAAIAESSTGRARLLFASTPFCWGGGRPTTHVFEGHALSPSPLSKRLVAVHPFSSLSLFWSQLGLLTCTIERCFDFFLLTTDLSPWCMLGGPIG